MQTQPLSMMEAPPSRWERCRQWLSAPEDIASLVAFRILFGVLMCFAAIRFFWYGWIDAFYIRPKFFFSYYGFSWVHPLPGGWMYVVFAAFALLAVLVAVGLWYRLSIFLFFCVFTYIELLDKTNYLNHYYLISLLGLLMFFMPLGKAGSLDVWRKPHTQQQTAPRWVVWTLRLQLGLVYFFAGLAKLKADWLLHGQPLKLWLPARGDLPLLGPLVAHPTNAHLMSIAGAIFDLTIVFFLLSRRTRPWAYLVVIGFHIVTWILFPIGLFPWIMIGCTLLFFSPSWPRRWMFFKRILAVSAAPAQGHDVSRKEEEASSSALTSPPSHDMPKHQKSNRVLLSRFAMGALACYFAIQLLMPLRGHLYPGEITWTEQGFRFSWNVMLIEKTGFTEFEVRIPSQKKKWYLSPHTHLTPLQVRMMSTQPDMILQYAHWLAGEFRKQGHPQVQVFAHAYAALNGRPRQRLIDPTVDLVPQRESFAHKPWIVPLISRASWSRTHSTPQYASRRR